MAHTILNNFLTDSGTQESAPDNTQRITLQNDGQSVDLPDVSYVRDASITRDGVDLVLETADGTVVIEGYYTAEPTPNLVAPDGLTLTPDLVNSFTHGGSQYADAGTGMSDVSPIGAVQEISGEATVTRLNGSIETIGIGTPIYQGDVIDTDESGAVNIIFVDDTTFAVSEDARLSIDEYVFDASTQSGVSNFSVLKGVFVFTSGLIGRDDPDDVMIDTPSGSIGIRGTIIAGDVNTGEITVIEGAIVLHDFSGNTITLSNQYETARFNTAEGQIEHVGDISANDVITKFMSVSTVAADLFSSIQDSATETGQNNNDSPTQNADQNTDTESSETQETESQQEATPEPTPEVIQEDAQADISLEEVITSEDIAQSGESDTTETQPDTAQPAEQDTSEPQITESAINTGTGTQDTQTYTPPPPVELAAPIFAGLAPNISGLDNFFSGSQDSQFSYNFSHEFSDPDGAITGYNLVSAPINGDINSYSLDADTGFMTITLDNAVTADSTFTFTVEALSDFGNASNTYTFDIYGATITVPTTTIFTPNSVYSGTDTNINIIADDVFVFTDGNNASNTVIIGADGSYVKTGDGADTIDINATGYHVYGDAGGDTFNITAAQGKSYGGGGDDDFILQNLGVATDFETLSTGLKIDGGVGNDLIQLATAGNIDFSAIDAGLINNIEKIAFINSQTNVINLDYGSVISMTDSDNTLVIDMDNNDTLNFTNAGNTFTYTGLDTTSSYDVYTDGTLTLLVDLDNSAVNGII